MEISACEFFERKERLQELLLHCF